jgi:hypothetical protein
VLIEVTRHAVNESSRRFLQQVALCFAPVTSYLCISPTGSCSFRIWCRLGFDWPYAQVCRSQGRGQSNRYGNICEANGWCHGTRRCVRRQLPQGKRRCGCEPPTRPQARGPEATHGATGERCQSCRRHRPNKSHLTPSSANVLKQKAAIRWHRISQYISREKGRGRVRGEGGSEPQRRLKPAGLGTESRSFTVARLGVRCTLCSWSSHLRRPVPTTAIGRDFSGFLFLPLIGILREEGGGTRNLWCGTVQPGNDGGGLGSFRADRVNLDGSQVRTAELGRPDPPCSRGYLLCIASRPSNSVRPSPMRPHTYVLADGGINNVQHAVEWRRKPRPNPPTHFPSDQMRARYMAQGARRKSGTIVVALYGRRSFPHPAQQSPRDVQPRRRQVKSSRPGVP